MALKLDIPIGQIGSMASTYIRVSDGAAVAQSVACDERGVLRDGFRATFSAMFMDGITRSITLRDAAGVPVTLYDEATGGTLKLNEDLIRAIEAEAAKLGMTVHDYTKEVLRYSHASAKLSGNPNHSSPAEQL